jgi:hypothetical protein
MRRLLKLPADCADADWMNRAVNRRAGHALTPEGCRKCLYKSIIFQRTSDMNKFLTTIIAAIFAAVSFSAVAADSTTTDTPKAQSKKSDKPAKKSKKKSKKAPAAK